MGSVWSSNSMDSSVEVPGYICKVFDLLGVICESCLKGIYEYEYNDDSMMQRWLIIGKISSGNSRGCQTRAVGIRKSFISLCYPE